MEKEEQISQLKRRLDNVSTEIHIARVPKHAKAWFVDYANDYFAGDYGMCLKHVIDTFRGMTPVGYTELQEQIDGLTAELEQIKGLLTAKEDKPKAKLMADGRTELR